MVVYCLLTFSRKTCRRILQDRYSPVPGILPATVRHSDNHQSDLKPINPDTPPTLLKQLSNSIKTDNQTGLEYWNMREFSNISSELKLEKESQFKIPLQGKLDSLLTIQLLLGQYEGKNCFIFSFS